MKNPVLRKIISGLTLSRKGNFILIVCITLLSLISAILSIINDIDIDIQKSNVVTGQVIKASLREIKISGIRRNTYKLVFYFRLNNSNENFAIRRFDEAYQPLTSNIKVGDVIKVYYRKGGGDYNLHVYQVEKGETIIASYADFNHELSSKTGILLLVKVLILLGSVIWYKQINIFKFLSSLVSGRTPSSER